MNQQPSQTLQAQLDQLMGDLKPHALVLLRTMLENRPKDIETLLKRNALHQFFKSSEQMIYQRLSTETEKLLSEHPIPKAKPDQLPNMNQRMSHFVHLEHQALETVLHPILDMSLVELEMEMLTEELGHQEAVT